MKEYKHGRSRKQQKIDRDQAYDEEEAHVDSKARERFRTQPMEYFDMCLGCYGKLRGGDASGQESPE